MRGGTSMRAYVLGLLVLTASSAARADGRVSGEYLLVRGGDEQRARSVLTQIQSERDELARLLALAPGYPKLVGHEQIPEFEKGRYAVALGVCPGHGPALAQAEGIVNAFFAETWTVSVPVAEAQLACPVPVDGRAVMQAVTVKAPQAWFSAALLGPAGGVVGPQVLAIYARPAWARLSDAKTIVLPAGCTAKLATDQDVLRVEKTCAAPAKPGTDVLRFQMKEGKVVAPGGLDTMGEIQAVVWGVGRTEEEAKAALARWHQDAAALPDDVLTLAPGYPKVVKGEEYPGLPPGKWVVLLGVCPAQRLPAAIWRLKAFDDRVTATKVAVSGGEPACPRNGGKYVGGASYQARSGALALSVVQYGKEPWMMLAYLRGSGGELVDWRRDDEKTAAVRGGTCGWVASVTPEPSDHGSIAERIRADLDCSVPRDDDTFSYGVEVTYGVTGRKISVGVVERK